MLSPEARRPPSLAVESSQATEPAPAAAPSSPLCHAQPVATSCSRPRAAAVRLPLSTAKTPPLAALVLSFHHGRPPPKLRAASFQDTIGRRSLQATTAAPSFLYRDTTASRLTAVRRPPSTMRPKSAKPPPPSMPLPTDPLLLAIAIPSSTVAGPPPFFLAHADSSPPPKVPSPSVPDRLLPPELTATDPTMAAGCCPNQPRHQDRLRPELPMIHHCTPPTVLPHPPHPCGRPPPSFLLTNCPPHHPTAMATVTISPIAGCPPSHLPPLHFIFASRAMSPTFSNAVTSFLLNETSSMVDACHHSPLPPTTSCQPPFTSLS